MHEPVQQILGEIALADAPANSRATSILAAAKVDANPKRKIKQYLAILRTLYYDQGLTDEKLEKATGIPANSLRPRRGELTGEWDMENMRWIDPPLIRSMEGGITKAGNKALRWYLTDLGSYVAKATMDWKFAFEDDRVDGCLKYQDQAEAETAQYLQRRGAP